MSGGGQERQRRAGTENVPGIVGQAAALSCAEEGRESFTKQVAQLRDHLAESLLAAVPDSRLNGHATQRLANNVNISFRGVRGDDLVMALDRVGIAVSAGAACGSSTWEPSHVLVAMGLSMDDAVGALRLTLGASNTAAEIERVVAAVPEAVANLRSAVSAKAS
jgi:cysteine desulfurase